MQMGQKCSFFYFSTLTSHQLAKWRHQQYEESQQEHVVDVWEHAEWLRSRRDSQKYSIMKAYAGTAAQVMPACMSLL